jgi:hypothetical protein
MERFTGVLVPFIKKSLDTKTLAGFEAMNIAPKVRAEATKRAATGAASSRRGTISTPGAAAMANR